MKNFFKKLSFVLASAMVITSLYAPANTSAAAKDGIILKGKAVTKKGIFVGGEKVNFDYKIGKHNNKGANGKWSVSDTSVITVDKHGKVTAVGTGSATLYLKVKKNAKKGIKKNLTFKVKINAMARADKLTIPASDKAITLKVGEVKDIMPVLTDKVEGVKNTYTLFARTDNPTDVAVEVKDNAKVVVTANNPTATSATITVFAAQKSNEDDAFNNKYKQQDTFTVDVKPNLEAMQTGAKTIAVKGADLSTDAAMYVLKTDKGVPVNLKSVKVNEAKTEAVLEAYNLPVGKYTVTYNKETELSLEVVKAVVKSIEIMPEDKFIITDNTTLTEGYVNYKVLDQFGNDVTKESMADIYATGAFLKNANGTTDKANKKVEFQTVAANKFVPNLTKITLTLVDKNTGVNKTAVLTASSQAMVWEAEIAGVYDTKNKKFVESLPENAKINSDNVTLDEFVLLVSAKDQYGNDFVSDATKAEVVKVNTILSSATNLKVTADASKVMEVSGKKYFVFKIQKIDSNANVKIRSGKVDVLSIVINNGSQTSKSFEVTPSKKVDNIEVYAPAEGIFDKKENTLTYVVTDVDGNNITDFDMLKYFNAADKNTLFATGLKFVKEKDKTVLKYTPSLNVGTGASSIQVVTFVTETMKVKTFSLEVKAAPIPARIKGIKGDVVTGITRGGTLDVEWKNIVFIDQFGNDMSYDDVKAYAQTQTSGPHYANGIGLVATLEETANGGFTQSSGNTAASAESVGKITVTAATDGLNGVVKESSKSNKVVVKLLKNKKTGGFEYDLEAGTVADRPEVLDTYNFEIHNVRLDDLKNVKFDKQDLYAPSDATPVQTKFDVKLVGEFNGKKIALRDTDYMTVDSANHQVDRNNKEAAGSNAFSTKKVQVILNDTAKTILSEDYKFGKEERRVVKLELKKADEISHSAFDVAKTFDDLIADNFKLVDQYGETITALPNNVKSYMYVETKSPHLTVAGADATSRTIQVAANESVVQKIKIIIGGVVLLDQEVTFKDLP